MKVKIVLKNGHRLVAIRDLRRLTGMSLQKACDLIPPQFAVGYSFEVDAYTPFNAKAYQSFYIIDKATQKKNEVKDRLKVIICECIQKDEFNWAKTLINAIEDNS